ncbi:g532 [Coccomyxa elongata]
MFQCIIYDEDAPSAKLIGVEYIISSETYASLDSDEQKLWHSHAYEVQSGMLYDPKGDSTADLPHMEALMTTYGKTWHTWQVDLGHKVPLGPPQLMMAFTKDGQLSPNLLASRDERCKKNTEEVKASRGHLKLQEPVHPSANHWETGKGEVMQVHCGTTPFKG